MHAVDMIFFWADMEPGRPAILLPDRILTYRGLADAIEKISVRLAEHDLDRREPVAIAIQSEDKFLAMCLAAIRSGFTVAPATPGLFPHLIANEIKTVVTDQDSAPGMKRIQFDDGWFASGPCAPQASSTADRKNYGHLIFFTSGTTGLPKKSLYTREASEARSQLAVFLGLSDYSRVLILPGLSTRFGFDLARDLLLLGKTACFCPLGEQALRVIDVFGIDFIHASTNQALKLCQLLDAHPEYSGSSVRGIRVGGSTPSKALVDRIREKLCKEVIVIYASTEGSQAATAPYAAIEHIEDAVGVVMPWTELQIVDDNGNVVPSGAQGKIRYRNEYFLKNQPADSATDSRGEDRWFYPGDLGLVTPEGVLCIKGRSDDVINRGGVKVSADRVEERLLACPGVKDAGVCGAEGLSEMTQLWIAVVPGQGFKPVEFQRFVQTDEALHQSLGTDIDQVFVVEEIPRGDLGKIKRPDLRDKLTAMLKAAVIGAR